MVLTILGMARVIKFLKAIAVIRSIDQIFSAPGTAHEPEGIGHDILIAAVHNFIVVHISCDIVEIGVTLDV